jgi:uncharacterized beta-barrel protein YwiB (DUF1934 family)
LKSKVIVKVVSKTISDGEEEKIELMTPGKFYKKGEAYFVVYEETEISGMEGTTTTLKIESDQLRIIRFGTTSSNLIFKKGIKHSSMYKTVYGIFEVIVEPSSIDIDVDENGGKIEIDYNLRAGGMAQSTNSMCIEIKA